MWKTGRKRAIVAQPRKCTLCKECERDDDLVERVDLGSVRDHFICKKRKKKHSFYSSIHDLKEIVIEFLIVFFFSVNIESTGSLPPDVLFTEAVKILEAKCETVIADF